MSDILGIGFVAVDIYYHLDNLPTRDNFATILKTEYQPGGTGANVLVQAAKLGASASFITTIGDDEIGEKVLEDMSCNSIDATGINIVQGKSSFNCRILLDDKGQKMILIDPGTSYDYRFYKDIDISKVEQTATVYTDLAMPEVSLPILERSYEAGCLTVFNMQVTLAPYESFGVTSEDIWQAVKYSKVFAPCHSGVLELTGTDNLLDAHAEVRKRFSGIAIYTIGEMGVIAFDVDDSILYVPALPVDVKDTTGAGDSFMGAFIYSYGHKRLPLYDSLCFSTTAAGLKCKDIGARETKNLEEITKELEANFIYLTGGKRLVDKVISTV